MTTYARLTPDGQTIQEISPHTADLGQFYTPEVAAEFVEVPDGTLAGYVLSGGDWVAPPAPPAPTPAPVVPPTVSAARFYQLFPLQSQIDIEDSDDRRVKQFLKNQQVALAGGEEIDLGSTAVQHGLMFLAATDVSPNSGAPRKYISGADVTRIALNVLP